jgi:hypothetical protein
MIKALVAAVLVLGGVGVVASTSAEAASVSAGTYVPLARPVRVVAGHTVKAGRALSARVGGSGAVAVTLTASGSTASGALVAYGASRSSTTNLQYAKGASASDTAVVPVSSGRIHGYNAARHGSVQVSVDVFGRYRAGSSSTPGAFHTLPTARRMGMPSLGAGRSMKIQLGGHLGVPAEPGAVVVTLTVSGAPRGGAILAHRPDEPQQNLPVVRFTAGRPVSSFVVLRTAGGQATLVNTSSRSVRIAIDVAGWYVIGFAQTARTFQTLVPTHVWSRQVGGGRSVNVSVAGQGGVPLRGVSAVLAVIHAVNPARAGAVQAWAAGTGRPKAAVALRFAARRSASNEVLIPVSSTGRLALKNLTHAAVTLALDVHGYVPTTGLTPPTSGSSARYVRNLDGGGSDAPTMQAEGVADAAAGSTLVLLDIGAQANDGTGVVLSSTATKLTYAQLVTALNGYLTGFANGGHKGTVAIGTNNGADDWTHYTAAQRGADWATKVVRAVSPPAGVTVIGANDIEGAFVSTEPQAAAWKSAFLAHVPGTGTALVYNGSADFCPKTWTRRAACNFGWTEARVYALAGGPRTVVLPQVYLGYMATQWAMINATGGGKLRFLGALTEHALDAGTLTPAQGWTALQRAMSSVTRTGVGRRVADIHA